MRSLGFIASVLHPSVYYHPHRDMFVLAHVDDFMCLGPDAHLKWFYQELTK